MNIKILAMIMFLREARFSESPEMQSLKEKFELLLMDMSNQQKNKEDNSNFGNANPMERFLELIENLINFLKKQKKRKINNDTILTDIYDILADNF